MFDFTNLDYIKNWDYLYYYNQDIKMIISAERNLIRNSDEYVNILKSELENDILNDPELKNKPKNEQEESFQAQYFRHYYEDSEIFIDRIRQSQRKASILSIFSLVEGQLKLITKLIENEFDFKMKIKHLNGQDYLQKYWIFLTKVFEIEFENIEPEFNLINQQKYIRNKIAHRNAEVEEVKIEFIKQFPGLEVITTGSEHFLEIDNIDYLYNLLDTIEIFFEKLSLTIDKRYETLKKP